MIRPLTALILIVAMALFFGLYRIKYQMEAEQHRADLIAESILAERDAIRVLRAEWSYLNQPERLQALVERHLALQPVKAEQIVTLQSVPRPLPSDRYPGGGERFLGGYAGIAPFGSIGGIQ